VSDELPKHFRKVLSEDEKEKFTYELALGYYELEELRQVFKLLRENFNSYLASEDMKRRVAMKRRVIDESPDALRIHARRAARVAIDEYAKLVKDPDAPAKTRMEAGRQLREYAMVADKEALEDPNSGGAVYIKTNLDMVNAKGVYKITAEEIDEQIAENERLAEESGAEQPEVDDFADLLGATT
jgi:cytochrome c1